MIICHPCQFAFEDRNPVLDARIGKQKQRMRNYSHFIVAGKWTAVSKGGKRLMRSLLLEDPQLAVIAESGQKHIIFRAKPGWWQFEEHSVRPFPAELQNLLNSAEALYAGFSKSEIATGAYAQHRVVKFGFARWRELESAIKPARGTIRLEMALFLARRGEETGGVAEDC